MPQYNIYTVYISAPAVKWWCGGFFFPLKCNYACSSPCNLSNDSEHLRVALAVTGKLQLHCRYTVRQTTCQSPKTLHFSPTGQPAVRGEINLLFSYSVEALVTIMNTYHYQRKRTSKLWNKFVRPSVNSFSPLGRKAAGAYSSCLRV